MSQMIESFMNAEGGEGLCARPLEYAEAAAAAGDPLGASANPLHALRVRLQCDVPGDAVTQARKQDAKKEHQERFRSQRQAEQDDHPLDPRFADGAECVHALPGAPPDEYRKQEQHGGNAQRRGSPANERRERFAH